MSYHGRRGAGGFPPAGRGGDGGDDSGTDTDDEGLIVQHAAAAGKRRPAPPPPRGAQQQPRVHLHVPPRPPPQPKGKPPPKRPAGAITLRTLLDAGFLVPGCKVLYVEYKGLITWADLTEDGYIIFEGKTFESPSAFSISVKRKVNPDRKADDGWKAVKYAGKLLEHFKEQYLRQQLLGRATPSGSGPGGPSPGSSAHPSPLHGGDGEDGDGPPYKRQRMDGDDGGRPGIKIKLKLKEGGPSPTGGPTAPPATGPFPPVQAPPIPVLPCQHYSGHPGSEEEGAQPFRLMVTETVAIVMDFHAHVSALEVGGLLGGTWDAASSTLTVSRAFPVMESSSGPGATSPSGRAMAAVRFDEQDKQRVLELIKSWGLTCVGSYRTHPAYPSTPNILDVRAQRQAQEEARAAEADAEAQAADGEGPPMVCAIISPYDPNMTSPPSSPITWFHVQYDPAVPLQPLQLGSPLPSSLPGTAPWALAAEAAETETACTDISGLISTQFQHTAKTYGMRATRAPLMQPWRPGQPQLCLDKLVASIVTRLPDEFEGDMRETYANMVKETVKHEFSLAERFVQPRKVGGGRASSYDAVAGLGIDGAGGIMDGPRVRRAARSRDNGEFLRFEDEVETDEGDDASEVEVDDDDEEPSDDDLDDD